MRSVIAVEIHAFSVANRAPQTGSSTATHQITPLGIKYYSIDVEHLHDIVFHTLMTCFVSRILHLFFLVNFGELWSHTSFSVELSVLNWSVNGIHVNRKFKQTGFANRVFLNLFEEFSNFIHFIKLPHKQHVQTKRQSNIPMHEWYE